MNIEMKHAEIILSMSHANKEKASKINDGEILDAVEKAKDIKDFEKIFQKLINSK